ncbi:MAG TPA: hypothetical protein VN937_07235 [Blastocatellia bacterium]|nr:hypothetical protein [Blastocatellia bacterium]
MTLEEIKHQYPNQWVLIEFTRLDDDLIVVDGKVIAHSPSRIAIDKKLAPLRNERIAVEFTGEGDTGETYLIPAIMKEPNGSNRSEVQQP